MFMKYSITLLLEGVYDNTIFDEYSNVYDSLIISIYVCRPTLCRLTESQPMTGAHFFILHLVHGLKSVATIMMSTSGHRYVHT